MKYNGNKSQIKKKNLLYETLKEKQWEKQYIYIMKNF